MEGNQTLGNTLVSVVVPVHDPGILLEQTIDSVLGQSVEDFELLVIDDGSTEDFSWVQGVDSRVRYLRTPNRGVSAARNLGVVIAGSDLVAFLDQDDLWHSSKLERQLAVLGEDDSLVHTGFDLIDEAGQRIGPGYGRAVSYRDMLAGELGILLSSALVRRTTLHRVGLFNPLFRMQQDLDVFLRIAQVGPPVYVDSVEVNYRLHAANASRDYWRSAMEILKLYELHELDARSVNDRDALDALDAGRKGVRRTYAHQAMNAARHSLSEGRVADTATALIRTLRLSPGVVAQSAKSWVGERVS